MIILPGHKELLPLDGDITLKVVVLKHQLLPKRYQYPRYQLIKAKFGFGLRSTRGKVFGVCIGDGGDVTCRRSDFIGIASEALIELAMADPRSPEPIDLSLREYMLIATDGTTERGDTVEQARQRIKLLTNSKVNLCYWLHPESTMNDLGFISYPQGAPPEQVKLIKGKQWTASH